MDAICALLDAIFRQFLRVDPELGVRMDRVRP